MHEHDLGPFGMSIIFLDSLIKVCKIVTTVVQVKGPCMKNTRNIVSRDQVYRTPEV